MKCVDAGGNKLTICDGMMMVEMIWRLNENYNN